MTVKPLLVEVADFVAMEVKIKNLTALIRQLVKALKAEVDASGEGFDESYEALKAASKFLEENK